MSAGRHEMCMIYIGNPIANEVIIYDFRHPGISKSKTNFRQEEMLDSLHYFFYIESKFKI